MDFGFVVIFLLDTSKRTRIKLFDLMWLTFVVSSVPVPPDIINEESSADIAVPEGEDATLVCVATGHPAPKVSHDETMNRLFPFLNIGLLINR
jgi:hypothetical protein